MNTRERRSGMRRRHIPLHSVEENVNPMDSMSNFADVMLVLAVGILLALVLRWNVPISLPADRTNDSSSSVYEDRSAIGSYSGGTDTGRPGTAVPLNGNDLYRVGDIPDGSQQIGNVYYDPQTGSYYVVEE